MFNSFSQYFSQIPKAQSRQYYPINQYDDEKECKSIISLEEMKTNSSTFCDMNSTPCDMNSTPCDMNSTPCDMNSYPSEELLEEMEIKSSTSCDMNSYPSLSYSILPSEEPLEEIKEPPKEPEEIKEPPKEPKESYFSNLCEKFKKFFGEDDKELKERIDKAIELRKKRKDEEKRKAEEKEERRRKLQEYINNINRKYLDGSRYTETRYGTRYGTRDDLGDFKKLYERNSGYPAAY